MRRQVPGTKPRIAIVVAIGENGIIGAKGDMPWRLSSDLKRFKQITIGKPVIMGRKTFDAIGAALPGRMNIVITRNPAFDAQGVKVAGNLSTAVAIAVERAIADGVDEICIIGGGQIYVEAMPLADRLYVTHVLASPSGDTVFPPIEGNVWRLADEETFPAGEKDTAATRYAVYERIQEAMPASLH